MKKLLFLSLLVFPSILSADREYVKEGEIVYAREVQTTDQLRERKKILQETKIRYQGMIASLQNQIVSIDAEIAQIQAQQ